MRKLMRALLVLCFSSLFAHLAHSQSTFQIFGGYSYVRPPAVIETFQACPGGTIPCLPPVVAMFSTHPNLNGWELSGTYNANKWLGATADFSGHYGSVERYSVHMQTYLFGPQVRLPRTVSPFAHILFGVAHEASNYGASLDSSSFAAAVGAGIDIKVARFMSLRVIQLDYLVTRFVSATQNQPRVSAGMVLRF